MTEQTTEITAYERSVALVKAELTQYKPKQIDTVLGLLQDGNTVPFIARYRKDQTGSLDEVQIREIEERQRYLENFEKRKEEISRLIDEQGKLALHVGKGASSDKEHGVDALSGASLTSKGVQGSFAYWFGENGYIPYLNKLKSAGAQ